MLETGDAAVVATAFGLGEPLRFAGPVARGEQGQIWRLETAEGAWAIKESFTPVDPVEVRRAGDFQRTAGEHGVPAPPIRLTVDGDYTTDLRGESIRAYGWVDVRPVDRRLDPAALGRTIARLHQVARPPDGPVHPWYTEPVGNGWDDLLERSRAVRAPHADRLAAVRPELAALEQLLSDPRPPTQLCHLDLWADNVRATADGGLCILDWDNAGPADPTGELALVLFEFGDDDPGRIRDLYRAYRSGGGPARITGEPDFAMVIAQVGHIGARHLELWLDPMASEPQRRRHDAGIDEFLGSYLSPATIALILTATADRSD